MKPEHFGEFLSRLGHRVIQTRTCFWYNAGPAFYFFFPYHRLINPDDTELNQLMWGRVCLGARFFTPLECRGKESYLIATSDKAFDFGTLSSDARRQTRRGLEKCTVRQIDFQYLSEHGLSLIHDTLTRQERSLDIWKPSAWKRYCDATRGLEGFEVWGSFVQDRLASFVTAFQMGDHFTMLDQYSSTEHLAQYPNNALIFTVTKTKISQPGVACVIYGPESLDAPESLNRFKFNMGFEKFPLKQRIVLHPMFRPFVNGGTERLTHLAGRYGPQKDLFQKAEGIIRFYREQT